MRKSSNPQAATVAGLEQTVAKAAIREDVSSSILEYAFRTNKKEMRIASLCGSHFLFETLINQKLRNAFYFKRTPSIFFDCAEVSKQICDEAIVHMPLEENSRLAWCTLKELFTKNIKYKILRGRFGRTTQQDVKDPVMYDVVWADYCSQPSLELIQDAAWTIANRFQQSGLYFMTFCLEVRRKGGRKGNIKRLGVKNDCLLKAIEIAFLREAAKLRIKSKLRKIYSVQYSGGSGENTTMITLGFAYNLPVEILPAIVEDRQAEQREGRQLRYQARYKIQAMKHRIERPRKLKVHKRSKSGKQVGKGYVSLQSKIHRRYDKGWTTERIAKDLGVGNQQVSSTLAWYCNPNSFKHIGRKKSK